MNTQKIFFGSNLKFLRGRKKMGQEELAKQLEIKRSKLSAIEIGQTKLPSAEDIINISEYFKISIDSFLKVDISKLGELKLRELEAGNDVYMTGSKIRVLAITVDKNNKENLEYVPVAAKAGYRAGYNDPEYIATLPKFSLPNLPKNGTFRMFPTVGDSMAPIPEGSDVIAQYVENWQSLKVETPCIIILKGEQEFVFKNVTVGKDGNILLKSLNELYAPYTVAAEEILEIWKYYEHKTNKFPAPQTDMDQLKQMLNSIKEDIGSIRKSR